MTEITYTNLLNRTLELYLQEDYMNAYNFITDNADKVKGNQAQIYNFRYSIACKANLNDLAMKILREAVVEKGYWYSYEYLMGDEDLKPLHNYSYFKKLTNLCQERENQARKDCKPDLKVVKPDNLVENEKYPLVIALHGNQENIELTEGYWKTCLKPNNILALPQSSQIEFSEAYNWNDLEKGVSELKEHYQELLNLNNVNPDNIIIGGFSAGARISLYAVLKEIIEVKGIILVGPWLPEIEEWETLLDKLISRGIKFYIVCGDKDDDCFENTGKFVDMLNKRNVANVFQIVEGLGHEYPSNFSQLLDEALTYVRK